MEPAPFGRWFCKVTAFGNSSGLFVDGFQMQTLAYELTKSIQTDIIYETSALRALVL